MFEWLVASNIPSANTGIRIVWCCLLMATAARRTRKNPRSTTYAGKAAVLQEGLCRTLRGMCGSPRGAATNRLSGQTEPVFDINAYFRAPSDAVAAGALALAWDRDWAASALSAKSPGVAIIDGRGIAPWQDLEVLEHLLTGLEPDGSSAGREVSVDDGGTVHAVSPTLTPVLAAMSEDAIRAAARRWHAELRRLYGGHALVDGVLADLARLAREAVQAEEQLYCWINC
jgi:hypothetical protein